MNSNKEKKRNHPYNPHERKTNAKSEKKVVVSEDGLSVKYFIHPHSLHNSDNYNFQRPIEVGPLLSEKRKIKLGEKLKDKGKESLRVLGPKYLVIPPNQCTSLGFDLKLGFSEFIDFQHQHGIDSLLKFISENKEILKLNSDSNSQKKRLLKPEFICWRGLLTSILTTPYEKEKDFQFLIIPYKGTFYLCEVYTDFNRQRDLNRDEKSAQFTYWGHKFETYITSDWPDEQPNVNEIPDTEDNYSTVVTSFLNEHYLMYAAEVDCCVQKEHKNLSNYCEIKTSKGKSLKDMNFEKNPKFFKWWIQSYLIDTQRIVVGLRDDNGIVNQIVECKTNEIYQEVTKRSNDKVCFNFLNSMFRLIRRFCNQEGQLYMAERTFNSEFVTLKEIEKSSHIYEKSYFLHDWYINSLK